MECLIIDGYNIINAWNDVFDVSGEPLEDCRNRLLAILSNYQGYKNIDIIVVFDAHQVKNGREKKETFDNLTVVYTKENETADNYIERFVRGMSGERTVRVATSDCLEQAIVLSVGGVRMPARELREEVEKVNLGAKTALLPNLTKTNTIMSHVNADILEKLEKMRRSDY